MSYAHREIGFYSLFTGIFLQALLQTVFLNSFSFLTAPQILRWPLPWFWVGKRPGSLPAFPFTHVIFSGLSPVPGSWKPPPLGWCCHRDEWNHPLLWKNVIVDTVVPMHIGCTVDSQPFSPLLLVVINIPIIPVKSSPQNSTAFSVRILFAGPFVLRHSFWISVISECPSKRLPPNLCNNSRSSLAIKESRNLP